MSSKQFPYFSFLFVVAKMSYCGLFKVQKVNLIFNKVIAMMMSRFRIVVLKDQLLQLSETLFALPTSDSMCHFLSFQL